MATSTNGSLIPLFDQGLHGANLQRLAREAFCRADDSSDAVGYYVLASLFVDLAQHWDERAVSTEEHARVSCAVQDAWRTAVLAVEEPAELARRHEVLDEAVRVLRKALAE